MNGPDIADGKNALGTRFERVGLAIALPLPARAPAMQAAARNLLDTVTVHR